MERNGMKKNIVTNTRARNTLEKILKILKNITKQLNNVYLSVPFYTTFQSLYQGSRVD